MFDETTKLKIKETAQRLKVPVAALMAVAEVESGGRLLAKVRGKQEPIIRFEGHYFDRFLKGDNRLEARAAGLSNPKAGAVKNSRRQLDRWKLLNKAMKINRTAALSSVSWGLGQVMGAHWQWLGYGSVDALVVECRSGVDGQVRLMARYIEKARLVKALQEQDWVAFARAYNGPGYRRNRYDTKMQAAFMKFSAEEEKSALPVPADDRPSTQSVDRLMFGARGQRVKTLQRSLTRLGYVLVADGLYGLVTDRVVRQFQRDHLLAENGIVGTKERELIFGKKQQLVQKAVEFGGRLAETKKSVVKTAQSGTKSALKTIKSEFRRRLLSISKRFA